MRRLTLLALAPALLAPHVARACGGFFCNRQPIDQSGENILFAIDPQTGATEVQVQISYSGDADNFAWIVPVTSVPRLDVGVNDTFAQLDQVTAPQFTVNWMNEGMCGYYGRGMEESAPTAAGGAEDHGVTVLARATVGPYLTVVLSAGNADELFAWLTRNGYRLDESTRPIIETYVREGSKFVALRLRRDQQTGDIQPLVMRFSHGEPCIPLRLTAIAAVADMPIHAYLLGVARGIPLNYRHVRIDWAAVDWLNYGYNYADVVKRAADAAGGNAFTTEFAGASSAMATRLYTDGRYDMARLAAASDPVAFMAELTRQFGFGNPHLLAILERHLPEPGALSAMGVSEQQFYNNIAQYASYVTMFDPAGAADEIDTTVVQPLRKAQALFDGIPKLTRLTTFISPEEMTIDPILAFNPDLPDVSNVHTADATVYCEPDNRNPIVFELPEDNRVVLFPDESGGYTWPTRYEPADVIEQLTPSGTGTVVANTQPVQEPLPPGVNPMADRGCACDLGGAGAAGAGLGAGAAWAALALVILGRRRVRGS